VLRQLRFDLSLHDWTLILLRSLSEVGAAYFFITALFHMPIASVSAILQALPLTVSLAASLFLGEALGWRRMTAIIIGFCGVLLIVRPGGADFNVYSLYALASVVCVTMRDLFVRRLSASVPSVFVALVAAAVITIFAALASLFIDWRPFTDKSSLQLVGATVFVIFGYVFSVAAMRVGEISFVAPFRYSSLLVALILGVLVFGNWPDILTLTGAAIVVATGLFTLYRESRLRMRTRVVPDRLR
jgi:S-adenosylmethionine uptake transporter